MPQRTKYQSMSAFTPIEIVEQADHLVLHPTLGQRITSEALHDLFTVGPYTGLTPLHVLAYKTPQTFANPYLREVIRKDIFNLIPGRFNDISPFAYLTTSVSGREILLEYPELLALVEPVSINQIMHHEYGVSVVTHLCSDLPGNKILLNNPHLVRMIDIKIWNLQEPSGASPLFYITYKNSFDKDGKNLLQQHPNLIHQIDKAVLNKIIDVSNHLMLNENIRESYRNTFNDMSIALNLSLLMQNSKFCSIAETIIEKIEPATLNHIIREDSLKNFSTLFFIMISPIGKKYFHYINFLNKISLEALTTRIESIPSFLDKHTELLGLNLVDYLMTRADGIEMLKYYSPIRKMLGLKDFNFSAYLKVFQPIKQFENNENLSKKIEEANQARQKIDKLTKTLLENRAASIEAVTNYFTPNQLEFYTTELKIKKELARWININSLNNLVDNPESPYYQLPGAYVLAITSPDIFYAYPELVENITSETLCYSPNSGPYQDVSLLYYLLDQEAAACHDLQNITIQTFFPMLLMHPTLIDKITKEALNKIPRSTSKILSWQAIATPLESLLSLHSGVEICLTYPSLIEKIDLDYFYRTKGKDHLFSSVFYFLFCERRKGIQPYLILLEHPSLILNINSKILNEAYHYGDSILFHLVSNPKLRTIFFQNPRLINMIKKEALLREIALGLSAPNYFFPYPEWSPLYWLLMCKDGREVLLNNSHLNKMLSDTTREWLKKYNDTVAPFTEKHICEVPGITRTHALIDMFNQMDLIKKKLNRATDQQITQPSLEKILPVESKSPTSDASQQSNELLQANFVRLIKRDTTTFDMACTKKGDQIYCKISLKDDAAYLTPIQKLFKNRGFSVQILTAKGGLTTLCFEAKQSALLTLFKDKAFLAALEKHPQKVKSINQEIKKETSFTPVSSDIMQAPLTLDQQNAWKACIITACCYAKQLSELIIFNENEQIFTLNISKCDFVPLTIRGHQSRHYESQTINLSYNDFCQQFLNRIIYWFSHPDRKNMIAAKLIEAEEGIQAIWHPLQGDAVATQSLHELLSDKFFTLRPPKNIVLATSTKKLEEEKITTAPTINLNDMPSENVASILQFLSDVTLQKQAFKFLLRNGEQKRDGIYEFTYHYKGTEKLNGIDSQVFIKCLEKAANNCRLNKLIQVFFEDEYVKIIIKTNLLPQARLKLNALQEYFTTLYQYNLAKAKRYEEKYNIEFNSNHSSLPARDKSAAAEVVQEAPSYNAYFTFNDFNQLARYALQRMQETDRANLILHFQKIACISMPISESDQSPIEFFAFLLHAMRIFMTFAKYTPRDERYFFNALRNIIRHATHELDWQETYHVLNPFISHLQSLSIPSDTPLLMGSFFRRKSPTMIFEDVNNLLTYFEAQIAEHTLGEHQDRNQLCALRILLQDLEQLPEKTPLHEDALLMVTSLLGVAENVRRTQLEKAINNLLGHCFDQSFDEMKNTLIEFMHSCSQPQTLSQRL